MEGHDTLTLGHYFHNLPDPRRTAACQHPFLDSRVIALGAAAPTPFWEDSRVRLSAMVWNGRRLVALEGRGRAGK